MDFATAHSMPRTCTLRAFLRPAAVAAIACLAGCATSSNPKAAGGRFVVNAPRAPFYKYGPAQSFGPDYVLTRGLKVTLLDASYGFSHVRTDDGAVGYVATEDLAPAPPEPPPQPMPKPGAGDPRGTPIGAGKPKRSNVQPTPGQPLFDVRDVPMPLPEPDKPQPSFRY